jgi:hypothetical protein
MKLMNHKRITNALQMHHSLIQIQLWKQNDYWLQASKITSLWNITWLLIRSLHWHSRNRSEFQICQTNWSLCSLH